MLLGNTSQTGGVSLLIRKVQVRVLPGRKRAGQRREALTVFALWQILPDLGGPMAHAACGGDLSRLVVRLSATGNRCPHRSGRRLGQRASGLGLIAGELSNSRRDARAA